MSKHLQWPGVVDAFRGRLEIDKNAPAISLMEGNTPLIPAPRLAEKIGGNIELHLKYEGLNPSGSFKDRGMTTAITQAVADGAKAVICASTGNTAASAAAYAARAGIKCIVLIPDGKIAVGKLAGAIAYGAQVVAIKGSFDDALCMVREATQQSSIALVNSINPARIQGQKTAAFEIVDALGAPPDWLCLPVGNAGNITSYWLGFCESNGQNPRLLGAQAEGAAPIVKGKIVEKPETLATAIRIGNPARWEEANQALRQSKGRILAVSDAEIVSAYHLIARTEGVFCEPSSAAGVAGLIKSIKSSSVDFQGKRIVCVLTGHGLKDPDTALSECKLPPPIEPRTELLLKMMEVGQ